MNAETTARNRDELAAMREVSEANYQWLLEVLESEPVRRARVEPRFVPPFPAELRPPRRRPWWRFGH